MRKIMEEKGVLEIFTWCVLRENEKQKEKRVTFVRIPDINKKDAKAFYETFKEDNVGMDVCFVGAWRANIKYL